VSNNNQAAIFVCFFLDSQNKKMKNNIWKEFTIRVPKGFFRVFIFKNPRAMREFSKESKKIMGIPVNWEDKVFRARGFLFNDGNHYGNIIFCKQWMGVGIVSHEMSHATLHTFRRNHWKIPLKYSKAEERFADIVEHLNKSFWRKFYAKPK